MNILRIQELNIVFDLRGGTVTAIHGISLEIAEGEILGVVGESGVIVGVMALHLGKIF